MILLFVELELRRGVSQVTNLRDWQKKARERREVFAEKFAVSSVGYPGVRVLSRYHAAQEVWDARNAEIDLLLQIIEKQSEAIERLTKVGPPSVPTTGAEWAEQALKDNCQIARTTQAEVQALVEKLVKDV